MTIYLDNAASSCPKPPGVIAAVDTCLRKYCANPGRGAHRTAVEAARIIFEARKKAASFLRVDDSANIIFTSNATDSINIAMYGYLSAGDHVVTTMVEHNAVNRPLAALSKKGISVSYVPSDNYGNVAPDDILAAIKPETRLAVLTHASNITGAIQPVSEVATLLHQRDIVLLVDAAQSAGTLPLDMNKNPIGMLACTGHKSLMGPQGIGFLYVAPWVDLKSVRQGGTGTRSEEEQDALSRPDRYESGTLNTPGIAGLAAGISYIEENGFENLAAHKNELTKRLHSGLIEIENVDTYGPKPGTSRGPLVAFNVSGMASSEVAARLDRDFDIASRAGLHCAPGAHRVMGTIDRGAVRLSVGCFNSIDEIEASIEAVRRIATGKP